VIVFGSTPYPGDLFAALLQSLVFIPFAAEGAAAGAVFPLYTLGWSLNYEVFFYLLFAVFIVLPARRAVLALGATLLLVVLAGWAAAPDSVALRFWSQPIVLEFGLGALIAWAWLGPTRRIGAPAALLLGAGALALVLVDPLGLAVKVVGASTPNGLTRLVAWGLPAAAVLMAAVFYEKGRQIDTRRWSFLVRLGDCSYSLYLMHPFALIAISKGWMALQMQRFFGWEFLALACLAGSVGLALVSYRWIEKPATRWLQGRGTAALPKAGLPV
jgi:exopolysaccharide production protein ExoZ